MNKSVTTIFFGSGPVAAESLQRLQQWATVEAVITKPRPAHHHGPVPVLDMYPDAFTVSNKRELSALFVEKKFASRVGLVIDFGIIIAQDVIDAFELGIVNSHFSLLPEWRGADPITFSILSGQPRTGISLMLIDDKMDEGPLLAQTPFDLPDDITTPQLTNELIVASDETLQAVLPLYLNGEATPAPQENVTIASSPEPTYSRKLTKEDGVLDFTKPAAVLEREIRAFIEWPKSRATIGSIEAVITAAHVVDEAGKPGIVERRGKQLLAFCGEGALSIDRLKPAGKAEMSVEGFLAGYGKSL